MSGVETAKRLLAMAEKDFTALNGMSAATVFAEEIFGFHVQQAVEKCLKAWLALRGKEYPHTHDVRALLAELKASGENIETYWPLVGFNVFAVQLRYESYEAEEEPIDRPMAIQNISELIRHVKGLLSKN